MSETELPAAKNKINDSTDIKPDNKCQIKQNYELKEAKTLHRAAAFPWVEWVIPWATTWVF